MQETYTNIDASTVGVVTTEPVPVSDLVSSRQSLVDEIGRIQKDLDMQIKNITEMLQTRISEKQSEIDTIDTRITNMQNAKITAVSSIDLNTLPLHQTSVSPVDPVLPVSLTP